MTGNGDARPRRRRGFVALRPSDHATPLADVAAALRTGLKEEMLARFERRGIRTLVDLPQWRSHDRRRSFGLDAETAAELDAQAALATLPTTPEANARLYAAGFARPEDIAALPRDEFVAKVGRRLPREVAAALHDATAVQERVLANVVAAGRTGAAAATTVQTVDQAVDASCGCEECRSAAGPAAYLADLLDYGVRHLRRVVAGRGLRGEYFAGAFALKRLERVDATIDFDWGAGAPDPRLPADGFSVRWTGTLRPRYSEAYQFTV
jgi:hypothetical protein